MIIMHRDDWRAILEEIKNECRRTSDRTQHPILAHSRTLIAMSENQFVLGNTFITFEADPWDVQALVRTMVRIGLTKPIQVRRAILNLEASLEAFRVH